VLGIPDDERAFAILLAFDKLRPLSGGSALIKEIVPSSFLRVAMRLSPHQKQRSCGRSTSLR
jgi:hypothetical protein